MRNYEWADFLAEFFGCRPDAFGNMPCDNGHLCDKCNTKEAQADYERMKKGRNK